MYIYVHRSFYPSSGTETISSDENQRYEGHILFTSFYQENVT